MKYYLYSIFILSLLLFSCDKKHTKEDKNPYWKVDETFIAPPDWETYTYANAFSISIPPYMRPQSFELTGLGAIDKNTLTEESLSPGNIGTTSFKPDKSIPGYNNYSRIYIEYRQGNDGDFIKRHDVPDLYNETNIEQSRQLIKTCLGSGILLRVLDRTWLFTNAGCVFDICYRRAGHTKDSGSTTVHIFILNDYDKQIFMTVSYNTKYKEAYKDLFNIVNTIKWIAPNRK